MLVSFGTSYAHLRRSSGPAGGFPPNRILARGYTETSCGRSLSDRRQRCRNIRRSRTGIESIRCKVEDTVSIDFVRSSPSVRPSGELDQKRNELTPGTVLVREWDRQSQRVMVLTDGFVWNGQTYDSKARLPLRRLRRGAVTHQAVGTMSSPSRKP
jgi:hypothetical protein